MATTEDIKAPSTTTSAPLAIFIHHLERMEDFINRSEHGEALAVLEMLKTGLPRFDIDFKEEEEAPAMAPITNTPIEATFKKAVLDFLKDVRHEVDLAQCVTACGVGALRHLDMSETQDIANTLQTHVDNELYEQVQKLDAMIQSVEAQEVLPCGR